MEKAVRVRDLSFHYTDTPILSAVNFEVERGEFIGLIGPNGGGKTTLLKLLMGFLRPQQGTIEIFGEPPHRARGHIGYVPQRLPFDRQFPISVMEVVLTGMASQLPWYGSYNRSQKKAAEEALERVKLTEVRDLPFGALSGGQAQRVLIARAIVSQPALLILDEPTSSLDVKAEQVIDDILNALRPLMTMLMVTHDLNAVIEQVDRTLCVQGTVFPLGREEVCQHFAYGLYHTPLIPGEGP